MDPVPTHYIDRDGAALAYQVVGEGPVDVVNVMEIVFHADLCWTDPDIHHLFERGASYSRTAYFQRRGFGLSDRITYSPTVEQQADDVLAVMDAIGMRQAILVGTLGHVRCRWRSSRLAHPSESAASSCSTRSPRVPSRRERCTVGPEAEVTPYIEGYREAFANWGSGRDDRHVGPGPGNRLQPAADGAAGAIVGHAGVRSGLLRVDPQARHPGRAQVGSGAHRVLRVPTNTVAGSSCRATWPS